MFYMQYKLIIHKQYTKSQLWNSILRMEYKRRILFNLWIINFFFSPRQFEHWLSRNFYKSNYQLGPLNFELSRVYCIYYFDAIIFSGVPWCGVRHRDIITKRTLSFCLFKFSTPRGAHYEYAILYLRYKYYRSKSYCFFNFLYTIATRTNYFGVFMWFTYVRIV